MTAPPKGRLGNGQLRRQVAEYLADHPRPWATPPSAPAPTARSPRPPAPPARSTPSPAPPDTRPGRRPGPASRRGPGLPSTGLPHRSTAMRVPDRGTWIKRRRKGGGRGKAAAPKSQKGGIRFYCLPGNRRPRAPGEMSCQLRMGKPVYFRVPPGRGETAAGIVAEPLDFTSGPEQLSSRKTPAHANEKRNCAGE